MARDLNEAWGWIQRLVARVSRLESGAMLENSSITNGRMRFIGGLLRVDSGGRVEIVGKLNADGTITFSGPFSSTGTSSFDGDVKITKTLDVSAATKLRGLLELLSDMRVKAGGKITIEGSPSIELSQPGGVATLAFGDGPRVYSQGAVVRMDAGTGTSRVSATAISAGMYAPNETSVTVSNGGAAVGGQLTVVGALINSGITTGTGAANTFVDTVGKFWKASSASRFKIDPDLLHVPDALLDVPVRAWIDMGNAERFAALYDSPRPFTQAQQLDYDGSDLSRVPGVIAEEVEAAGGGPFVTYDAEGVIEGVMYDRLALARTQVLAQKLDAMTARFDAAMELIAELQEKLAA